MILFTLLKKGYFWPNMRDEIMQYTKKCLIFQQDKLEKTKVSWLLRFLSAPTRPWKSVSLYFITPSRCKRTWSNLGYLWPILEVCHICTHAQAMLSQTDNPVILQTHGEVMGHLNEYCWWQILSIYSFGQSCLDSWWKPWTSYRATIQGKWTNREIQLLAIRVLATLCRLLSEKLGTVTWCRPIMLQLPYKLLYR